jgi:hypothetical protein
MVNFAKENKAMVFQYEGIYLYHLQPDFDVKRLSTWVWRWDGECVASGSAGLHIQPCLICGPKKKS